MNDELNDFIDRNGAAIKDAIEVRERTFQLCAHRTNEIPGERIAKYLNSVPMPRPVIVTADNEIVMCKTIDINQYLPVCYTSVDLMVLGQMILNALNRPPRFVFSVSLTANVFGQRHYMISLRCA